MKKERKKERKKEGKKHVLVLTPSDSPISNLFSNRTHLFCAACFDFYDQGPHPFLCAVISDDLRGRDDGGGGGGGKGGEGGRKKGEGG
jgi:hypothetical protein